MVCPINNKKRVLYVKTQTALGVPATITAGDALRAIDVSFTTEEEGTIDRSDVWSGSGAGAANITGSLSWNLAIQTEFYPEITGTSWSMRPLFEGSPVTISSGANPVITPRGAGCYGVDIKPFTIEIHEEGGAIWRVSDCTAVWSLSAEPGGRVLVDWEVSGNYEDPIDNPGTLVPSYKADQDLPFIYKNSSLVVRHELTGEQENLEFPNCPSFTFTPGIESSSIPSACTPNGRSLKFLAHDAKPELVFSGVIREKPSVQPIFQLATQDIELEVEFILGPVSGQSKSVGILLPNARLSVPALSEVDKYLGTDLTFTGTALLGNDQYSMTV